MSEDLDKSFAERREAGLALVEEILSPEARHFMDNHKASGGFCSEISEIAVQNVFAQLWTRPGLDRRSRSLLTLGILTGLRSREELQVHFSIALKNGLSVTEIEEIVYHATAYAGFPASNVAREAAGAALIQAGLISAAPSFDPSVNEITD